MLGLGLPSVMVGVHRNGGDGQTQEKDQGEKEIHSGGSKGAGPAKILERVAIFLQGIFSTQGLNPHLLHWQVDSFFFLIFIFN